MYANVPSPPRYAPPPPPPAPPQQQQQQDGQDTEALVAALESCVRDALEYYMYDNAVFYAERLHDMCGDYTHLHLLAQCYARGGDAATACRLLQSYYPFFADTMQQQQQRPHTTMAATVTATPTATHSLAAVPQPQHCASSGRMYASPLPRRGGGGGAVAASHTPPSRTHATATTSASNSNTAATAVVEVDARWRCQYLLGVCCAQTSCYDEGSRVLTELIDISATLEQRYRTDTTTRNSSGSTTAHTTSRALYRGSGNDEDDDEAADAEEDSDDDKGSDGDKDERGGGDGVSSSEAQRVLACLHHVAEAHYWLGVCEQHRRSDAASECYRHAVCSNPLLFCAFDAYMRSDWQHKEACVRVYDTPVLAPSVDVAAVTMATTHTATAAAAGVHRARHTTSAATRVLLRRGGGGASRGEAAARAAASRAASSRQRVLHVVRRFVQPYARALYLLYTYRCAEAQCWLREHIPVVTHAREQQQQQQHHPRLRDTTPPSAWQLTQLALAHFHDGDMRASALTFAQLLRRAPWRLDNVALVVYSTALWQLHDERALSSLAQVLIEAAPLSPITLCVTANLYSLVKETKEALVMLQRAVHVAPHMAYAHALRGYELLALDRAADAAAAFEAAVSIDRALYVAYAGLGEVYARGNRLDAARGCYRKAVLINPLPAILQRYAATYQHAGATRDDLAAALQLYKRTLTRHPHHLPARLGRAEALLRLGRVAEAHDEVLPLLQTAPDEAAVHVMLARCLQCAGQTKRAIRHYTTAVTLDPRREAYIRGCLEQLGVAVRDDGDEGAHNDDGDDEDRDDGDDEEGAVARRRGGGAMV